MAGIATRVHSLVRDAHATNEAVLANAGSSTAERLAARYSEAVIGPNGVLRKINVSIDEARTFWADMRKQGGARGAVGMVGGFLVELGDSFGLRAADAASTDKQVEKALKDLAVQGSLMLVGAGVAKGAAALRTFNANRRMAAAVVEASKPGFAGPAVESVELLKATAAESLRHAHDVEVLVKKLGSRAVGHDIAEHVSVSQLRDLILEFGDDAPSWLSDLVDGLEAAGRKTFNVGKADPHILAGLARSGKADTYALALHELAAHHSGAKLTVEGAADLVNALRMSRVYRHEALAFDAVEKIAGDMVTKRWLSHFRPDLLNSTAAIPADVMKMVAADVNLVKRAVDAQRSLEAAGRITNYATPLTAI